MGFIQSSKNYKFRKMMTFYPGSYFKLDFFKCFDRKWNTVPNQSTGNREGLLHIFSSNLFN